MKLFDTFKKKKEKNNNMRENKEHGLKYPADSIIGQWEDGKLSAEDIMLFSICEFYECAMSYAEDVHYRKQRVEEHNEKIERMKKNLEEVKNKESFPGRTVVMMLLQSHKNDKNHLIDTGKARFIFILNANWPYKIINMCKKVRDDEGLLLTKEGFLKYCQLEAIKEQAAKSYFEKSPVTIPDEQKAFCYPSEEQLALLFEMVETLDKMSRRDDIKELDPNIFLSADYAFQLPDENGVFHEVEENVMKKYVEMDYEGVV